jgi:tRNA A-37 threonylcarbamoyl transferase component Bud32
MPKSGARSSHEGIHIDYFRGVLRDIRRIMSEKYGLSRTSIRPIRSDASHLSIPVKIVGVDASGSPVRYFGKILGSNDIISDRSMQFFKNLYLQMNAQDPIFGFTETAEDMARQQYESLLAIYRTGIPTAKPFGYHKVEGGIWLLLAEHLDSRPVSQTREVTPDQINTLFGYLRRLHTKGIYHGDIKADNLMLGDRIFILDCGVFREDVDRAKKQAYDVACLVCSFLDTSPPEETVKIARKHYARNELIDAVAYLDLIQQRQDFHFNNQQKQALKRAMRN